MEKSDDQPLEIVKTRQEIDRTVFICKKIRHALHKFDEFKALEVFQTLFSLEYILIPWMKVRVVVIPNLRKGN